MTDSPRASWASSAAAAACCRDPCRRDTHLSPSAAGFFFFTAAMARRRARGRAQSEASARICSTRFLGAIGGRCMGTIGMVCPGTLFHRRQWGIPMPSIGNRSQITESDAKGRRLQARACKHGLYL
jgi:hypothetical protein